MDSQTKDQYAQVVQRLMRVVLTYETYGDPIVERQTIDCE